MSEKSSLPEEKNNSAHASPPHGAGTILFVDDESALRNMGEIFLRKLGYKVLLAAHGEEAIRIYGQKRIEISAIILDLTMPKLSGAETCKEILKMNPNARILLASGYTAEGLPEQLIREGARDFLAKPYTIQHLAEKLEKILKD